MRKYLVIACILMIFRVTVAQEHGVGLTIGLSGYYGDIGQEELLYPNKLAYGFSYKWYRYSRWVPRLTMSFLKINPNSDTASNLVRNHYGYSLTRAIREITAGFEFSFFPYKPWLMKGFQWTPYFVFELAAYQYRQYSTLASSPTASNQFNPNDHSVFGMAIPFGFGLKVSPWHRISIALEARLRYLLDDRIDDAFFVYENYLKTNDVKYASRFSNVNTKDFYTFVGFTVTYILGNRPCIR